RRRLRRAADQPLGGLSGRELAEAPRRQTAGAEEREDDDEPGRQQSGLERDELGVLVAVHERAGLGLIHARSRGRLLNGARLDEAHVSLERDSDLLLD